MLEPNDLLEKLKLAPCGSFLGFVSKEELWSYVWLISQSERHLGEIFSCLLYNYIGHASIASTPLKHNREEAELKGTVYMKHHCCATYPKSLPLVFSVRVKTGTDSGAQMLYSSRTTDVAESEAAGAQLLQFYLWNCFMHHLKFNTIYRYCR